VDDDAAELARLRRRAYGPGADIARDPAALARLIVLEDAARGVAAAPPVVRVADDDRAEESARATAAPPRRRGWHIGLTVGVAAVALILGTFGWRAMVADTATGAAASAASASAPHATPAPGAADPLGAAGPFAGDPAARVLNEIAIGGSSTEYFDRPVSGAEPPFPVPEDLLWSAPIGDYYGREVWLARSRSGLPCLAVVTGVDVRADCRPQAEFDTGALVVVVPYSAVAPDERPTGMTAADSLGYAWLPGDAVTVVVGRANGLRR
jgi:hypothetical protein